MISAINWDSVRRANFSINLELAYVQTGCKLSEPAAAYLRMVENIMPIISRQAAAVAIATAMHIDASE